MTFRLKKLCWNSWVPVLCLLLLSHAVQAKNKPSLTYTFNDNDTVPVVLSSVDINRLIVKGDKITSVDCPAGFCVVTGTTSDLSGAARLSLNLSMPFTAYVTTAHGRNFGLFITPKARPAVTSEFIGINSIKEKPSVFDKDTPYASMLTQFTEQMITWLHTGKMMDGFSLHPVDPLSTLKLKNDKPLSIVPATVFVGKHFNGIIYRVTNNSANDLPLTNAQFYSRTTRSASVSKTHLSPNSVAHVFVVSGGESAL